MHSIALLIPVFNRLEQTKKCLNELSAYKDTAFFAENNVAKILIDDASTDGTEEWVLVNHPDVVILKGTGILWWSGCMNLGVKYAIENMNADFILLWQDDISTNASYFESLQNIIVNRKRNDIHASKIYYKDHPDIIFAMGGTFNSRTGYKVLNGRMEKDNHNFQKAMPIDWFCGQGILIPVEVFKRIGMFDEINFPQYHGDSDFALRAKKAKFNLIAHPDLRLWNDVSTTGISHTQNKSLKLFIETLYSIKSNNNIKKDIAFYRRHSTSILAYKELIHKYLIYTASYIKWKILGLFGITRKNAELY